MVWKYRLVVILNFIEILILLLFLKYFRIHNITLENDFSNNKNKLCFGCQHHLAYFKMILSFWFMQKQRPHY